VLFSEGQEATPAAVNVMPESILLADGRIGTVVIVAAHDGGASHGIDEEWLVSFGNLGLYHLFESFDAHPTSKSITWDSSHLVQSHSANSGCPRNGIVRLDWCEANWLILRSPAFQPDVWEGLVPGAEHGHHVRLTATWIEAAIDGLWVEAESLAKEFDTFDLHHGEDRRNVIDMDAGVKDRCDELGYLSNGV